MSKPPSKYALRAVVDVASSRDGGETVWHVVLACGHRRVMKSREAAMKCLPEAMKSQLGTFASYKPKRSYRCTSCGTDPEEPLPLAHVATPDRCGALKNGKGKKGCKEAPGHLADGSHHNAWHRHGKQIWKDA